jgi:hypothetical protein
VNQRIPLVKAPSSVLTTLANSAAEARDNLRRSDPTASFGLANDACDRMVFFIAPGQAIDRHTRKLLERQFRRPRHSRGALSSIEFEFSPPANKIRDDEGLPEDFRPSLLRWAIKHSGAVIVAVGEGVGGAEPCSLLRPVQTVIRCSKETADIWVDYLGRRIRPHHCFAIVRFASEVRA